MLDPFADPIDWSKLPPGEHGMVEHLGKPDTQALLRMELAKIKSVEGKWPNPASLSRFNSTSMSMSQLKRFTKYVKPAQLDWITPCWIWHGGVHEKGYGRFYLGKDPVTEAKIWSYTHRIAFEHWIGFLPDGYIGDHQCNHKICCNPIHVWPETNAENLRLADQRRPWKRRNQYSQE